MRIYYATFHLPKAGNKDEEYEDAFFPQETIDQQEKHLCFGIADGASKSLLSKHWARILLDCLQQYEVNDNQSKYLSETFLEESLNIAYKKWKEWTEKYFQERKERKKPIKWYEEPGLKKGAFSTFLFLKFIEPEPTLEKVVDQFVNSEEIPKTESGNCTSQENSTNESVNSPEIPKSDEMTKAINPVSEPNTESGNLSEKNSTNESVNSPEIPKSDEMTEAISPVSESNIQPSDLTSEQPSISVAERQKKVFEQASLNREEFEDTDNMSGKWIAVALGDSCLFQVRDNKLIYPFPVSSSAKFNNTPLLISSNPSRNHEILHAVKVKAVEVKKEDYWQKGDRFYLMTDALACWFLNQCEKHNTTALEFLSELNSQKQEQFKEWISTLRDNKEIRNDDVTLISIDIH
ncbi:hypothetical protein G7B40_041275 [Aetokthonos hydrillicola Thurmond2011]|jgi:hypothetical protein|uniref:Protein phosphatase 2C domain-containing protein n=1 Tax=Aetokthonos hydrillicola Thurmond2011 TaxID=2712845 RepID=A0AAP5MEG3_9CYAN|nr:hypothetical protein [Aetokthonos hydrillicola]MBO3461861.1 hypothetical protein [Aetokthonos hydrillicola CCALA 1050]MBW4588893.1 hypothetical protein [Aetokthonos hydrillicola CCALA 1050]MDR9900919.1 hypothetical protein [Aetokthonos hydrillicola Thurmond2011]